MQEGLKYYARMDPIEVLRSAYINKKKIKLRDNKYLCFEKDIKFPLYTSTAWLSPLTKKQYNIGSLWLFLEYGKDKSEYMSKVAEFNEFVEPINIADKAEITNYFTGVISDSNCISSELRMLLLDKSAKRDEPEGGFENEAEITGKQKEHQLPFQLKVIEYISKFQRPTGSKTRSLRCPQKSFNFFLNLLKEGSSNSKTGSGSTQGKSRLARIFEKKKYPIIIVPESIQAGNVNLSNIEQFLLEGEYQEPRSTEDSFQRKIEIQSILRGKKVIFEVTNNPVLLSLTDWDNVAAVFTLGNKNEFSSWKIRDPLELFKKTKGFLLRYSTISKEDANDWNVKTFVMERNTRYRDQEVQKKIWTEIEDFLFQKVYETSEK